MGNFRGNFLRFFSALLVFFSLIFFAVPAFAEDDARPPIRVGYSSSGSMLYRDSEGRFQGYDAVYLYEIARYTGWTYTFVPYNDWSQAVADLAAGKIDILPTVLKTPEREQQMDFSLYPMAQTSVGVVKRPDDTRFVYGETASLDGARIGVRRGTADTKSFQAWMARYGLSATLLQYHDRGDLLTALETGNVDLVATSYSGDAQKFPLVAEFSPQSMYFAVPKSRPDISSALDQAMANIQLYNAGFRDALMHIARPTRERYRIFLSDREAAFLATVPTLRVALYRDHAPYSYIRDDGTAGGIAVRVLERIADLTGLSFEYVFIDSRDEEIEKMQAGDIDMLGYVYMDLLTAEQDGLRLTTPYYDGDLARISRTGSTGAETAIPRSLHFLFESRKGEDDSRLVVYDSTTKALQAFGDGEVDAVYCDAATAGYLVNILKRGGTDMQLMAGVPAHISMALPKDADLRIGLVLDRTIQYLDDVEMDEIEQREINEAPMTFGNLLDHLSTLQTYALLLVLLVFLAVAAYLAFMLYRQRAMERRTLRIAQQQEQMSEALELEKRLSGVQMEFYRYISMNTVAPIRTAILALTAKGAMAPESQLHTEYVHCWQLLDFLFEVRALNDLTSDDPGALVREHKSPYYNPDPDWQPTLCRTYLEEQGRIASGSARRKGVTFALDFSGVLDTLVLMERRGFSMVIMRILSYLLKETPPQGVVLFSAALNGMEVGRSDGRAVLWLFFTAPGLHLAPELVQSIEAMRTSVKENPRSIYESLIKAKEQSGAENQVLLRFAILQLIIPALGGEWEITSTGEKGTEVTVEFLVDATGK